MFQGTIRKQKFELESVLVYGWEHFNFSGCRCGMLLFNRHFTLDSHWYFYHETIQSHCSSHINCQLHRLHMVISNMSKVDIWSLWTSIWWLNFHCTYLFQDGISHFVFKRLYSSKPVFHCLSLHAVRNELWDAVQYLTSWCGYLTVCINFLFLPLVLPTALQTSDDWKGGGCWTESPCRLTSSCVWTAKIIHHSPTCTVYTWVDTVNWRLNTNASWLAHVWHPVFIAVDDGKAQCCQAERLARAVAENEWKNIAASHSL